jgi:hypothetical protein
MRVREILELYEYLSTGWKLVSTPEGDGRDLANTRKDFLVADRKLQSLCTCYAYYPSFSPSGRGAKFDPDWHPSIREGYAFGNADHIPADVAWLPLSTYSKYESGWVNPEYDEMKAVYHLARIAQLGELDRLKKCNCGRWLYARFSHQRFCSAKCREKAFRSDPAEKEKRRRWARENYWLHRNKNVK